MLDGASVSNQYFDVPAIVLRWMRSGVLVRPLWRRGELRLSTVLKSEPTRCGACSISRNQLDAQFLQRQRMRPAIKLNNSELHWAVPSHPAHTAYHNIHLRDYEGRAAAM
jgi:hypothetical protein